MSETIAPVYFDHLTEINTIDLASQLAEKLNLPRDVIVCALDEIDCTLLTKPDHVYMTNIMGRFAVSTLRSIISSNTK